MVARTLILTAAVTIGIAPPDPPAESPKQCGVSWVAGRKITALNIQPLVEHRVNWIVQTPFGWQRGIDSPAIRMATSGSVLWGETDKGLAVTTKLARDRGIQDLAQAAHLGQRGRVARRDLGWRTTRSGPSGSRATGGSKRTGKDKRAPYPPSGRTLPVRRKSTFLRFRAVPHRNPV